MDRETLRARIKARGDEIEKAIPFTAPVLGAVYVKLMSAARASALSPALEKAKSDLDRIVLSAASSLCDVDGALLYDATNADDLAELARLDLSILNSIVQFSNRKNATSLEGAEEAGNG